MTDAEKHTSFEELTARYLAGELAQDEIERLEKWVLADKSNKELFLSYRKTWNLSRYKNQATDDTVEKAWRDISLKLFPENRIIGLPKKNFFRPGYTLKIAASVAALVGVAVLLYLVLNRNQQSELTATNMLVTKILNDGTEVTLNCNSQITYPETFKKNQRKITLSGDAFFKVTPDATKPFIIETNRLTVKVLGTSFYLQSRNELPNAKVTVAEGSVEVKAQNGNLLVLTTGEEAVYDLQQKNLTRQNIEDQNYLSWKTNVLIFEDEELPEVIQVLQNTYHIKIQIQDKKIANCHLTATFDNLPLEAVFNILEETLNMKVGFDNQIYVLQGVGCE